MNFSFTKIEINFKGVNTAEAFVIFFIDSTTFFTLLPLFVCSHESLQLSRKICKRYIKVFDVMTKRRHNHYDLIIFILFMIRSPVRIAVMNRIALQCWLKGKAVLKDNGLNGLSVTLPWG